MSPPWAVASLLLLTHGYWPLRKLPKAQDLPGAALLRGAPRCPGVLAGVWAFLQRIEGGFLELWCFRAGFPVAWSCGAGQTAWRRGLVQISRAIRSHSQEMGHASDIFQIIKGNSKELSSWLILEKGTSSCRIWSVSAAAEGRAGRASGHIPTAPRAARVA